MARTDAQVLMAQGRREGRREGRKEGREEGIKEGMLKAQREMLLLERKFGPLSEEVMSRIAEGTESQLTDLALRLVDARSLEELDL